MNTNLQGTTIGQILTAVFFCLALSIPAGASGNPAGLMKAGAIIDQPVFNAQGQGLGEIEDLVVRRNGSVKKALIAVGGLLDLGEKLVSVRYKSLKFTDGKIMLDATKKQLDEEPEFDLRKHDLFTNYRYRLYPYEIMPGPYGPYEGGLPPGYRRRWTEEGVRIPQSGSQEESQPHQPNERLRARHRAEGMPGMQGWDNRRNWAYYPAQMLASVILGQAVVNKQGEEVATVEDLTINAAGKVDQLILSYGSFLDIGDKLAAVPYRPVGFTNRGITYDITRRELENLPKFK